MWATEENAVVVSDAHHQLPTEPVAQTTQGPPLPGSPRDHGKPPAPGPLQRLASFWSMRKGRGGQATSAFCSHPVRYQPREHIWILKPQLQVHQVLKEHWQAVSLQLTMARSSEEAPFCPPGEPWNVRMIACCLGWTWLCAYDPQRLPFSFRPSFQKTPNFILFTLLWIYPKEMTHYSGLKAIGCGPLI